MSEESSFNDGWIIKPDLGTSFQKLAITLTLGKSGNLNPIEGSAIFIIGSDDSVIGVAKFFRMRMALYKAHIYFEQIVTPKDKKTLTDLGLKNLTPGVLYSRLEWDAFDKACNTLLGHSSTQIMPLKGDTPNEQAYVRELLKLATQDDLLGPANGPFEEIVGMSVRDRYLVGKLAPRETLESEEQNEALAASSGRTDPDSANSEVETSSNRSLVPSSIGFTFCVDGDLKELRVEALWGRYLRGESETVPPKEEGKKPPRAWKRIPSGGSFPLKIADGEIEPVVLDHDTPDVVVQGTIRAKRENGDRLITLFLVNNQDLPTENQDEAWIFQPEIIVKGTTGKSVFRKKSVLEADGSDVE